MGAFESGTIFLITELVLFFLLTLPSELQSIFLLSLSSEYLPNQCQAISSMRYKNETVLISDPSLVILMYSKTNSNIPETPTGMTRRFPVLIYKFKHNCFTDPLIHAIGVQ